jgi:hypothetical protein
MTMTLLYLAAIPPLQEILMSFLVLLLVLAVVGGLLWAVENWVSPLPPPVKLIIAIVIVILIVIWALRIFAP